MGYGFGLDARQWRTRRVQGTCGSGNRGMAKGGAVGGFGGDARDTEAAGVLGWRRRMLGVVVRWWSRPWLLGSRRMNG